MTTRTTMVAALAVSAAVAATGCGTTTANGGGSGSSTGSSSGRTSGATTGTTSGSGSGTTSGTSTSGSAGTVNGSGSGAASGVGTGAAGGSGSSGTSGSSNASGSSDAGAGAVSCDAGLSATASAPLGAPCVPEEEGNSSFGGFSLTEVGIESNTFACASRICLVDHFQGRVTCPYGQDSNGSGPDGSPGCVTPGSCAPVRLGLSGSGQTVTPQCSNRQAADAVYCSCRCANENGGTDDAGPYCTCPSDMICTQFGLPGGYCVKADAEYDAGAVCSKCDPTTAPCP
jgi:hypothetical protein